MPTKWLGPALACLGAVLGARAQTDLPDGKAKQTIENTCHECHGLDKLFAKSRTRPAWQSLIKVMVDRGATLTDAEFTDVVEYLYDNFGDHGADQPKLNVNKSTAKELETGLELPPDVARAIVRYREAHGNFKEWRDLVKVDGVAKDKIEAKKDRLSF